MKESEYDPLDLFSGSKDRICKAIGALFSTPENNFRVFLNGSLIFGCMGRDNIPSHQVNKTFEDLIKVGGLQLSSFLELLGEVIFKSGILDRLLATQKLDVLDIEGAIHAYYNIVSQPCSVCKSIADAELLDRYSFLHSLPMEKSLKIVREFLVAATAKDCSLIISFRPRESGITSSDYSSICLKSLNRIYYYKVPFQL